MSFRCISQHMVLIVLVLVFFSSNPAVAASGTSKEVSSVGSWKIYEIVGDPDHQCRISKRVSKQLFLIVSANANEGFSIGMVDLTWKLNRDDTAQGYIRFDQTYRYDADASVENEKLVLLHAGAEESSPEIPFRRSNTIFLEVNGSWLETDLRGSSQALDLLYTCVEEHSGTNQSSIDESVSDLAKACYPMDTPVKLTGYLFDVVLPGPPEYTSIDDGDRGGTALFLYVQDGICVSGMKGVVHAIQLVCQKLKKKEGIPVTLSGELFKSHTGYHWSPVLLSCSR